MLSAIRDTHQQNRTPVPEGTRRYAVVPDVPDHLGYLHPEFEVSVVRETFDRELRMYAKVRATYLLEISRHALPHQSTRTTRPPTYSTT